MPLNFKFHFLITLDHKLLTAITHLAMLLNLKFHFLITLDHKFTALSEFVMPVNFKFPLSTTLANFHSQLVCVV
jgi:hypothetical protein